MPPIMDNMTDRLAGLTLGTLALLHAGYPDRPILIARDHAIEKPSPSSMQRWSSAGRDPVVLPFGVTPPPPA